MESEKKSILIVDDEQHVRMLLERQLKALSFSCVSVGSSLEAVEAVEKNEFDLMLLDINMPTTSGVELLRALKKAKYELPVVMVSGYDSVDLVRMTMREGAYDYLIKPWNYEDLKFTVKRAIEHGQMVVERTQYYEYLELRVEERTREVEQAFSEIRETYRATILALGSALETRDTETQSHCLRVAHYSKLIAGEMGIADEDSLQNIEWGAFLHDIGKIGVPDSILLKAAALTEQEWQVMRRHPEIGAQVIEGINFLKGAAPIVRYHHERYDGGGYPEGLKEEQIPVEARIFAAADAIDAMLSDRPYRKGMPLEEVKQIVSDESGLQFDPAVVAALNGIADEELRNTPKMIAA